MKILQLVAIFLIFIHNLLRPISCKICPFLNVLGFPGQIESSWAITLGEQRPDTVLGSITLHYNDDLACNSLPPTFNVSLCVSLETGKKVELLKNIFMEANGLG